MALLLRALLSAALLLLASSPSLAYDDAHAEPQFFYEGESHFDFGKQLGETFAPQIQQRLQQNAKLQTLLLPFHATVDGKALYAQYLDTHTTTFPVRSCS